jgi:thioesterase domain-containing protein
VLFRCARGESEADDDLGWWRYLSNLRVVDIPADHMSIMRERNAAQMIRKIAADVSNIMRYTR